MPNNLRYTSATEAELNNLLTGKYSDNWQPVPLSQSGIRLHNGSVGVVWRQTDELLARPLVLFVKQEDHRRLFARFAQLRSDLSPLTAWCHVVTPEFIDSIDIDREVSLGGFEAAWTGLIVAEACLLAQRSAPKLKIAACYATQTYCVARTKGLWAKISIEDALGRYEAAHGVLKNDNRKFARVRTALEPIWKCLLGVAHIDNKYIDREYRILVDAISTMQNMRLSDEDDEAHYLYDVFRNIIPEASFLRTLANATPETRVEYFDQIVRSLEDAAREGDLVRRHSLAFLAGYLATVAAGGRASLSLAEGHSEKWPEIVAWAYTIGGIGERVVWTSGFDGLGRLVARELMRPLRLDEAPTSDFSIDEAVALVDPQLNDPLIHLKIKQSRVVSVSLFPGVNIAIPIMEAAISDDQKYERRERNLEGVSGNDPMAIIANALWPYLQERMLKEKNSGSGHVYGAPKSVKSKVAKKAASQTKLALKGDDWR